MLINFELRINAGAVHNKVVNALAEQSAQFDHQFKGQPDLAVLNIANMSGGATAKSGKLILCHFDFFSCGFNSSADKNAVNNTII